MTDDKKTYGKVPEAVDTPVPVAAHSSRSLSAVDEPDLTPPPAADFASADIRHVCQAIYALANEVRESRRSIALAIEECRDISADASDLLSGMNVALEDIAKTYLETFGL